MEPDLSLQVEQFIRNALRQRKLEDRLVRQALRDLRLTLAGIERVVGGSGVLAVGPAREENIRRLVAAVSRSVQESFSVPQLAALEEALTPFVQAQLDFARQMVQRAGGSLTSEGAVQLTPMQASRLVNQQVVAGKTLEAQLTQVLPAAVADRVERFIRLGLSDVGGETFAKYQDAVVRITENNVEAIIRTGTHEAGSAAQQLIYQFETDPDWMGPDGLVWTAIFDSRTCPVCLKLDRKRFPTDYQKVSPHPQCRCMLLPWKWRNEDLVTPEGTIPRTRPANGDGKPQELSVKVAAKTWVKDNPETAQQIFGKKLGQDLIDGKVSFDQAVKRWRQPKS